MSIFLISKEDVYKIDAMPIRVEEDKFPGKCYLVRIFRDPSHLLARKIIGFTDSLLASRKISETDMLNLAMRQGGRLFTQGSTEEKASVTTDSFDEVQGKEVDKVKIDSDLMILIAKFFEIQPTGREVITVLDLFVSTNFKIDDIRRRLLYLNNNGLIEKVRDDFWKITPKGFEKTQSNRGVVGALDVMKNKYFQLVPLPRGVKEPFVFVVMPFGINEINPKVYSDIIKPTVEKDLNVLCVRSDEVTDPGVINNQIFTLINKAKIIVAEITSKNLNVFYEIGMAHTFNKDVFLFAERKSGRLPFDITTNRAVFYDDLDDLKQKIVDNLKRHIS